MSTASSTEAASLTIYWHSLHSGIAYLVAHFTAYKNSDERADYKITSL